VALLAVLTMSAAAASASPRTWVVCPDRPRQSGCHFRGDLALQAAIDRATSGDTVLLRKGRYFPVAWRDVPYKEIVVRGQAVIDGKDLTLRGEAGVILDGSARLPATALVIRRATVTLRDVEITGYRYDIEEDDIYEGHGIFVIDGRLRAERVTISRFQKMGLVGRGATSLDAAQLSILDGHVGIWLHETATLRLDGGVLRGNDSSAVAAYDQSVAHLSQVDVEGNRDDGLYTEQDATLFLANSRVLGNSPVALHAVDRSRVVVTASTLVGNAKDVAAEGEARIWLTETPPMAATATGERPGE
jgi:hypothetical protein